MLGLSVGTQSFVEKGEDLPLQYTTFCRASMCLLAGEVPMFRAAAPGLGFTVSLVGSVSTVL